MYKKEGVSFINFWKNFKILKFLNHFSIDKAWDKSPFYAPIGWSQSRLPSAFKIIIVIRHPFSSFLPWSFGGHCRGSIGAYGSDPTPAFPSPLPPL